MATAERRCRWPQVTLAIHQSLRVRLEQQRSIGCGSSAAGLGLTMQLPEVTILMSLIDCEAGIVLQQNSASLW